MEETKIMERNTKTAFVNLKDGDRFYIATDKAKEVWQRIDEKKTGSKFTTITAQRDNDKYPSPIKANTQVIFLRHTK